jgi:hypothetical protein
MYSLSLLLQKQKALLEKSLFFNKSGVCDCIRSVVKLSPTTPLLITIKEGALFITTPPSVKSELYTKKETILKALKEGFPNLKITDIR